MSNQTDNGSTRAEGKEGDAGGVAGTVLDALYNRLLLRDICAKVVPGAFLLLTIFAVAANRASSPADVLQLLTHASAGIWLVLVPAGWLTAFGMQSLGEIARWPLRGTTKFQFIRYFPSRLTEREWHRGLLKFGNVASASEKQTFERFVVIKEATGNMSLCLLLVLPLLVRESCEGHHSWNLPLATMAAALPLFRRMHGVHVERQQMHVEVTLDLHDELARVSKG